LLEEKEDKMDAISIEAMLSEANITVKYSRVIFLHISQFFWEKTVYFGAETRGIL